mgnify:CR=1 FL=1
MFAVDMSQEALDRMMAKIAEMRKAPVGTFVSAYESIEELTTLEIEETVEIFKANNQ